MPCDLLEGEDGGDCEPPGLGEVVALVLGLIEDAPEVCDPPAIGVDSDCDNTVADCVNGDEPLCDTSFVTDCVNGDEPLCDTSVVENCLNGSEPLCDTSVIENCINGNEPLCDTSLAEDCLEGNSELCSTPVPCEAPDVGIDGTCENPYTVCEDADQDGDVDEADCRNLVAPLWSADCTDEVNPHVWPWPGYTGTTTASGYVNVFGLEAPVSQSTVDTLNGEHRHTSWEARKLDEDGNCVRDDSRPSVWMHKYNYKVAGDAGEYSCTLPISAGSGEHNVPEGSGDAVWRFSVGPVPVLFSGQSINNCGFTGGGESHESPVPTLEAVNADWDGRGTGDIDCQLLPSGECIPKGVSMTVSLSGSYNPPA